MTIFSWTLDGLDTGLARFNLATWPWSWPWLLRWTVNGAWWCGSECDVREELETGDRASVKVCEVIDFRRTDRSVNLAKQEGDW